MYHSGRSEDLALVFAQLAARGYDADRMFGLGYSLGGNILLKYLAETGSDACVSRAVSVSAPLDLSTVSRRLEAPRNRFYHRWLLDRMKLEWGGGPLDLEVPEGDDCSGSETSDDERPPRFANVGDRAWLERRAVRVRGRHAASTVDLGAAS